MQVRAAFKLREPAHWTYLRVTDQLHRATLVGGEAGNLTHDAADGLHALACHTLLVDAPGRQHTAVGKVTTVDAPNDTFTNG